MKSRMMLGAKYSFSAIGTVWNIETALPLTNSELGRINSCIESFDATYSRFRVDSLVSRIGRGQKGGTYEFPDTIQDLWRVYTRLYELSKGAINPLVGKSLEAIGYDSSYSLIMSQPAAAPIFETVRLEGISLRTSVPVLIDVGAVGKGMLVDLVAAIIAERHDQYVVDASGDMRITTDEPQTVGLEHPGKIDYVIGTLAIRNGALCASATNRRAWGQGLHHIIDARTGLPTATTISATWALTSDAFLADGLATGLFFVSGEQLINAFGHFYYVVLHKDGRVKHNLEQEVGETFA